MVNSADMIARIIISEGAEGGQAGSPPVLIGPTLTLNMPVVPTALSFNVSVLTYGVSFAKPQQLKLNIIEYGNPQNNVFELAGNLPALDTPKGTMVFNFAVHNAVFRVAGRYEANVYIDGVKIASEAFVTLSVGEDDANSEINQEE